MLPIAVYIAIATMLPIALYTTIATMLPIALYITIATMLPIALYTTIATMLSIALYNAIATTLPIDRPARPRTQHDCHHDMKVKPEAATVVIELLMMGGKTPETC
jgi:hypothetical protein